MPQAIGFVMAGAGGVSATVGIGSVIAFQAASLVVMNVISRKLVDKKRPIDRNSNARDITVRATDAYETFVYGKAMVPGITVYNNAVTMIPSGTYTGTPNNRYVHVVAWAGHRVSCLELFRLDDRYLDPSVTSIGWDPVTRIGSGYVYTGVFKGTNANGGTIYTGSESPTRFRWYDGKQSSADYVLLQISSDWSAEMVGRERAYGALEIAFLDQEDVTNRLYQQGIPQNVFALVHGKAVYDHRRHSLNGDPQVSNPASWWTTGTASADFSVGAPSSWALTEGVGGTTNRAVVLNGSGGIISSMIGTELMSCDPSSLYTWYMRARRTQGDGNLYRAGISYWTDNGDNINNGASTFWYYLTNADVSSMWTDYYFTAGSGGTLAIPSSARLARPFVLGINSTTTLTTLQIQELSLYHGWGSRHLIDVSSTWEFSASPAWCAADYLRNERFGFGRESRQSVNASRYALNGDPSFRRHNTYSIGSHWTVVDAGSASALSPLSTYPLANSIALSLSGPSGRRGLSVTDVGSTARMFMSTRMPVDPSGHYAIQVSARQPTGNRVNYLLAAFYTAAGSNMDSSVSDAIGWDSIGVYHYWDVVNAAFPSTWSTYLTVIGSGSSRTIPSSAAFMAVGVLAVRSTAAPTTTVIEVQNYVVQAGTQIRQFIEPHEQIDWPSVSSAADWCAGQVSTPSGTQTRFTTNGQGNTGRSYRENLRDILGSGNLRATYTMSGWRIFGGWQEPNVTLNAADIVGQMEVRGTADTLDRYNTVRGMIFDRHQDYKLVPSAPVTAAEYRYRDGSRELLEDVDLPFTNDWFGAQRVQFGLLEQGDNQMIAKIPAGNLGLVLQAGRQFAVALDVMSWSPKTFMLTEANYSAVARGAVLSVREDFAASYVDPTSAEYLPRTTTSVGSATPVVPQISSVAATYLGRDGARITWVNPSNRAFEWVDVYRGIGLSLFSSASLWKSTRNNEIADPDPFLGAGGATTHYWFRTRDVIGLTSSVYPTPTSGVVVAPSVPQVSSVTISIQPDAVRLRWVNTSDNRLFEWVDVYRRQTTNAFSGSSLVRSTRGDEHLDQMGMGDNFYAWHYWFVTRDHLGNQSSVYPGLTSSFSASPMVPVAKDPEYVFFEEFNYQGLTHLEAAWERISAPFMAGITFPASGITGGQVIRASSGQAWYVSRTRVPYDSTVLYRMSVRARMTTSHAQRGQYFGFIGYRADGVTPIDIASNQTTGNAHYFVRTGQGPSSLDLWEEHIGHVSGYMPWPGSGAVNLGLSRDPKWAARMHDLVRYVSPLILVNYQDGTGAQEVDYVSVAKVPPSGLVHDINTLNGSSWVSGGNGVFGSSVWDLLYGQRPDYRDMDVGSRFSVIGLPISNNSLFASVERFRPDFHTAALANNSAALFWSAEVYGATGGDAYIAAVYVVYTKTGSACYFGQGTTFTISSRGVWQTAKSFHRFFPADINPTSYPPPWFVSVGASALSSTTSVFVSKLRVDVG